MKEINQKCIILLFCVYMVVSFPTWTHAQADECFQVNCPAFEFLNSQRVSEALETLLDAERANSSSEVKAVLNSMPLVHFLDRESRADVLNTLIHARPEIQTAALEFMDEQDADFLSEALFSDFSIYVRSRVLFRMFQVDRKRPQGERLFEGVVEELAIVETDPGLLALADYYFSNCAEDGRFSDSGSKRLDSEPEKPELPFSWALFRIATTALETFKTLSVSSIP